MPSAPAALGYELTEDELTLLFARFKELADRKKLVDEGDIHALMIYETGDGLEVGRKLN